MEESLEGALHGAVDEGGDALLLEAVCGGEHHHAVPDAERVHVVHDHVVGLWQQCWLARHGGVLVEDDLQEMWRQHWGVSDAVARLVLRHHLGVAFVVLLRLLPRPPTP